MMPKTKALIEQLDALDERMRTLSETLNKLASDPNNDAAFTQEIQQLIARYRAICPPSSERQRAL